MWQHLDSLPLDAVWLQGPLEILSYRSRAIAEEKSAEQVFVR